MSGILSKNSTDTSKYQTPCISAKIDSLLNGKLEISAKPAKGQGSW